MSACLHGLAWSQMWSRCVAWLLRRPAHWRQGGQGDEGQEGAGAGRVGALAVFAAAQLLPGAQVRIHECLLAWTRMCIDVSHGCCGGQAAGAGERSGRRGVAWGVLGRLPCLLRLSFCLVLR